MNRQYSESNLMDACLAGNRDLLVACLAQGMKVNKRLPNGLTPIIVCCQNRFSEAIPVLCEKGAVLNEGCGDTTALLEAVRNKDYASVQHLLRYGANPDIGTKKHLRPLMLAARMGSIECVRLLLEGGADAKLTDKYLWSPLHEAAAFGHEDCVRLLLSCGADPLCGTKESWEEDHPRSVTGFVPLFYAARGGHKKATQLLLEYTPVDIRDNGKGTPLMFAGEIGNYDTVATLLAAGADIEAVNRSGVTPLIMAVFRGDLNIIRLLLESGANPNVSHKDMGPPIINAICPISGPDNRDKTAIIELLMEFGADINLPCGETGDTALHQAVCAKDKRLVGFLLEHGARYGSRCYGRTEVDIARIIGDHELEELLLKYGPRDDL